MDQQVVSHCVGSLSRDYLPKLPHHILPCTNLQRIYPFEKIEDYIAESFTKEIPWKSSVPAPIFQSPSNTSFQVLNGLDPTTSLIRDKMRWQMKKDKILKSVKKDKKSISEKTLRRAEKVEEDTITDVPHGVALLAEHLDKDPDPQFAGVYNWYYSGGTLATLVNNEENYLLHTKESKLCGSKYNEGEHETELLFMLDLEQNTPIYQIATSAVGAVTRQKSCVSLFSIGEDSGKISLNKIHSVTDKKNTFLSVALRNKSNKKYCTLTSNGILKLWDVEYTKGYKMKLRVGPGKGVSVMDRWSSIQFVDSKTLLLADRCCIHLLDARVDMSEKQLAWCPRKLGEKCEQVSYVTKSRLTDHTVYTMTTHQALTLDLRIGFCQRWSHMMTAPPYLGVTHPFDNNVECLCLGSQVMSDCVAVINRWRGDDPRADYRPTLLPSPAHGLLAARQQGLCLEPTLSQRCSLSMVGLTSLPCPSGMHVLRQSATGDIFVQQLVSADGEISDQLTDKQLIAYSKWSQPTVSLEREPTTFTVSEVKNFTPLLEVLTEPSVSWEEPQEGLGDESGGWRRSKQYLEDCVDLLAPRLLAVWEVEDEEEWHREDESVAEQDPAEKVHNWLQAGLAFNDRTLPDASTLKPTVSSTPFVMPAMELESPSKASEDPSPWMTLPGQTLRTPSTPAPPPATAPSPLPSHQSSGSDGPSRKRRRLLQDSVTTPHKQVVTPVKKPPVSTAKKKFIPGF